MENRYDAYFDIKLSFEKAVTDKDGAYHQYADKLTWFPYKGIPTYPLFHRDSKNEEFSKEYTKAIYLHIDDTHHLYQLQPFQKII